MTRIKLAGATLNQVPLDWENNLLNIREAIAEAKRQQANILLMPELALTGYGCEDVFLSDWLSEKAWEKLLTLLPDCSNIVACIGLPIRLEGKTYNGVCVIKDQRILGITLKQNLANEGVHYEPRWFVPWISEKVITIQKGKDSIRMGDLVYETDGITFGFEICEDAWSANRPGHRLQKRGVQLILNPSASHFAMGKAPRREKEVIVDGSAEFDCLYLFVNHLGNEAGRMIYDGDIVFGQQGEILALNNRLSFKPWNLLTLEVDTGGKSKSQHIPLADSRDRNEEFARAVSLALYDYLRKSRARGFVLSLSGGADSSTCAVLVAEMVRRSSEELGWPSFWKSLGRDPNKSPSNAADAVKELLTCAYQSTRNSSAATLEAAKVLAESIGSGFMQWSVDEETHSYTSKLEDALGRKLNWNDDDIALQNIQARSRSPIIWLLANVKRAVLLTTSNRSEGDVGYATMDGDTSGSLAPLAGVDKRFILQWLSWAETSLGYSGLRLVNSLTPTAELRPAERAQTDEQDLMPYEVLLAIELLAIQKRQSPKEVFEKLKSRFEPEALKAWIRTFFRLWSANQWKRERLAPSFHVDDHNIDPRSWCRFPILSGGFREELDSL